MSFSFSPSSVVLVVGPDRPSVETYISTIERQIGDANKITFVEQKSLKESTHGKESVFDGVVSVSIAPHSDTLFSELSKTLKPGGSLYLREPALTSAPSDVKVPIRTDKETFLKLTLAGFVDIKTKVESPKAEELNGVMLSLNGSAELLKNHISMLEVVSSKPDWNIGAKEVLKIPLKKNTQTKTETVQKSVWALNTDDITENDLEDEDKLLGEDDLILPTVKKDDCEVGKGGQKKACKNCTCGRKEGTSVKADPQFKSSCGNCYLGDAFRCSGCPYLGTPAFKPGEKVELDLTSADI